MPTGASAVIFFVAVSTTATWKGHTGRIYCLAFSPDSKTLASGAADKTVLLRDVASGKEIDALRDHVGPVCSVVFSAKGDRLITSAGDPKGVLSFWELPAAKK